MDEHKERASCGCDCAACLRGDHMKCTKPDQCSWEPPKEDKSKKDK